jgi:hypothetical protein
MGTTRLMTSRRCSYSPSTSCVALFRTSLTRTILMSCHQDPTTLRVPRISREPTGTEEDPQREQGVGPGHRHEASGRGHELDVGYQRCRRSRTCRKGTGTTPTRRTWSVGRHTEWRICLGKCRPVESISRSWRRPRRRSRSVSRSSSSIPDVERTESSPGIVLVLPDYRPSSRKGTDGTCSRVPSSSTCRGSRFVSVLFSMFRSRGT